MTRLFPRALSLLVLFPILWLAGDVLAGEAPAGSVVAARGSVTAGDAGGSTRPLKIKSELFVADTVRTGSDGRAQLMFRDNTIISLGSNASLKVAEYQWDAEKKSGAMKTRVEEGTFRVLGGLITKTAPKNFSTETPAATIGIRGSMYAGKASGVETLVVFLGGKGIVVFNSLGQVEITRPGYGVRVRLGEPPGDPRPFTPEEIEELIDSLAKKGLRYGEEVFQVSDRTTDFNKGVEDNLPFDPNGYSAPIFSFIEDVARNYAQYSLLPETSGLGGTVELFGTAVGVFTGPWGDYYLLSGMNEMDSIRLLIDRDNGTLDGSFSVGTGGGYAAAALALAEVPWGGYYEGYSWLELYPAPNPAQSVYFNDQAFISGLTCTDGPCVFFDYGDYDLDPGGYLVTAPQSAQFSPYMTWGYWAASFTVPGEGEDQVYTMQQPGAYWLAGQKTPDYVIEDLVYGADYTATYQGPAYGVRIDDFGVNSLTGGATTLHADFANNSLWGDLRFDQHTISFSGEIAGDGYPGSFNAWDAGPGFYDTTVVGAFYGPDGQAVGGSFVSRNMGDVVNPETYQGIFGGNLTGTAPSTPTAW